MANKVRKDINNGLLYKSSICDLKIINTSKTVQRKELGKNNELHF